MSVKYYPDMVQGSDEWLAIRCGLLTASEMKLVMTTNWKPSDNETTRAHVYKIVHQRATRYVPPHYISPDMLRGKYDEPEARILYEKHRSPVTDIGFVTRDIRGFTLGYSPDGLVGNDGLLECKSRREDLQTKSIIEDYLDGTVPDDYILQIQTGLLVTGRKWLDFVSYSNGEPMAVLRSFPDLELHEKIIAAATAFEIKVAGKLEKYRQAIRPENGLIPTERRIIQEMFL